MSFSPNDILREGLKCFYLSREGNTGILLLAMNSWHRKTLFFDKIGLCIGILWKDFEHALLIFVFSPFGHLEWRFQVSMFFSSKFKLSIAKPSQLCPGQKQNIDSTSSFMLRPESKHSTEWGGGALLVKRSGGPLHSHSRLQQPSDVLILTRA